MGKITNADLKNYELSFEDIDRLFSEDKKKYETKAFNKWSDTEKYKPKYKDANEEQLKTLWEFSNPKKPQCSDEELKDTELYRYLVKRIFPSNNKTIVIIENGALKLVSHEHFGTTYKAKMDAKDPRFYKFIVNDCAKLYNVDVYAWKHVIDTTNGQINVSKPVKHCYNADDDLIDEKNGKELLKYIKEIICSNNETDYDTLIKFLYCCINKKQSQLILCLASLGGVGKSFFIRLVSLLLGDAYSDIDESLLNGAEKFNAPLIGRTVVAIDESSGKGQDTYKTMTKNMKNLSTSPTIVYREMHSSPITIRNFLNFIFLTNYFADLEAGNRRAFILRVSCERQNDQKYFGFLESCINAKSVQWLFNYIYDYDELVGDIKTPLSAPDSDLKAEYRQSHMNSVPKFLIQKYIVEVPEKDNDKKNDRNLTTLYDEYVFYVKQGENKMFGPCKRDVFLFNIQNYCSSRVLHGTKVYDVSRSSLIQTIVNRSKETTMERINEMIQQYKYMNEAEDVELGDGKTFIEVEYERLSNENIELQKKVQELEARLRAYEKTEPKDDFLSKNGFKLVDSKEKPKMAKEVMNSASKNWQTLKNAIF